MQSISLFAGSTSINNLSGSGLGFFGGSFGQSVQLNSFQDTTFITDGNGTNNGGAGNNVKYSTDTKAFAAGVVPATGLLYIPNEKASLNIRFSNDSAVRTQNAKLRIFDRTNKNHPASGVITRVCEFLHPSSSYDIEGSGDTTWWGSTSRTGNIHWFYQPKRKTSCWNAYSRWKWNLCSSSKISGAKRSIRR